MRRINDSVLWWEGVIADGDVCKYGEPLLGDEIDERRKRRITRIHTSNSGATPPNFNDAARGPQRLRRFYGPN